MNFLLGTETGLRSRRIYIGTLSGVSASNTRNSCPTVPTTFLLVRRVTFPDSVLGILATWEHRSVMVKFVVVREFCIILMLVKSVVMVESDTVWIAEAVGAMLELKNSEGI